jgi:hypothetical protein
MIDFIQSCLSPAILITVVVGYSFIAVLAWEIVRQRRITRRIERDAKSGLSHRQLVARGMI